MKVMIQKFGRLKTIFFMAVCLLFTYSLQPAFALTFPLPESGDIVGEVQTANVREGESLGDIGRRYDVGVIEMIEANPNLDPWVPTTGAIVVIPTQFILPKGPRKGIILNLAEMRLYYFHPDQQKVSTFPIGIGKKGWSSPHGKTFITGKKKDPIWNPPNSIRKEHIEKGDPLPAFIPSGPDNPLGGYALYISAKGLSVNGSFLLHGSNRPGGIGVRSSHGCIRLFPADIEQLFYMVPIGTTVQIIHEPFKVGWHNGHLYLEAHQPLTEAQYQGSNSLTRLAHMIEKVISKSHLVNWSSAKLAVKTSNGYPVRID